MKSSRRSIAAVVDRIVKLAHTSSASGWTTARVPLVEVRGVTRDELIEHGRTVFGMLPRGWEFSVATEANGLDVIELRRDAGRFA